MFMLGGLWYSPLLFARKWMALMGMSEADIQAASTKTSMPLQYLTVLCCGLVTSWVLAVIVNHFSNVPLTLLRGAMIGGLCWLGLAGATSFGTALFSMKPKQLWLINSGYNLVSFVIASAILAVWR
jgi:hypothetical protein